MDTETKTWSQSQFFISTDPALIPVDQLSAVFASDDFYWAKELPTEAMTRMVNNSLCLGVYETPQSPIIEQIKTPAAPTWVGFARVVTDYVTFGFLTDVWIKPSHRGHGLGKWLVRCVHELVDEMPHLRRVMLFTADWDRSVPLYEEIMHMSVIETSRGKGLAIMECKGKGHPSYGKTGNSYD